MPGRSDWGAIELLRLGSHEPGGLQVEHALVAAAQRHQLLVGAKLDHPAVLQHADSIRLADGGEAVRDQDRGAVTCGLKDAVEDLSLPANVELGCGLVEEDDPGPELHGA